MPPKRASRSKAAVAAAAAAAAAAVAPAADDANVPQEEAGGNEGHEGHPPAAREQAEPPKPHGSVGAVIMHIPHVPGATGVDGAGSSSAGPPGIGERGEGAMSEIAPAGAGGEAPAPAPRFVVMRGFDGYVWPRSTSVACFWCCHPFEGQPVGLPLRYAAGVFHVQGCFCSLECALALNRHERRGFAAAESSNLLQLMAQLLGRREPLRPAPSRCLLPLFGGGVPIDEFRGAAARDLCVHLPPMMAVVPNVEEVSSSPSGAFVRQDARIPLDMTRIKNATDKARSGTRRVAKNTLEAAMPNLKVT